jgi:hypothetical protein
MLERNCWSYGRPYMVKVLGNPKLFMSEEEQAILEQNEDQLDEDYVYLKSSARINIMLKKFKKM